MPITPTPEQFSAYQAMFDYFNEVLFSNTLPPVMLNFSRRAKCMGFFAPERWGVKEKSEDAKNIHEISINPETLTRPLKETASTLVHEMCHLWQQDFGKPSRNGYHNREWARKMNEVGLKPVSYDNPGKETGQRVSHTIVEGGSFDTYFKSLPANAVMPLECVREGVKKNKAAPAKVKLSCPVCGAAAWVKPDSVNAIVATCGDHGCALEAA